MKKLLLLAAIFAVVFTACPTDDGNGNNNGNGDSGTTLTIRNESFSELIEVKWSGDIFADKENNTLGITGSVKKTVTAGTGYIFFSRKANPIVARTRDLIVVEAGQDNIFRFNDNTTIVEESAPNNTGTLKDLIARIRTPEKPTLRVGDRSIRVSWTAIDNATSYKIYYNTNTTPPETFVRTTSESITTITITDLTNDVTYYVWLQAENASGISELSEMAWATPTTNFTTNSREAFLSAIESINEAADGTYTITLTGSFGVDMWGYFLQGGSSKTIIIKGDTVTRTLTNNNRYENQLFMIPSGTTVELGNNITLNGNNKEVSLVIVDSGGTFIMNSGSTVSGAYFHGVQSSGTFIMNGGTINGNVGSGVFLSGGSFTMNDGTISNNRANQGGGVNIENGSFTMNGGTISGNASLGYGGGGVCVTFGSGYFTKTGGTIDDTNSATEGTVAYVNSIPPKVRNTTAGPTDNLDSTVAGSTGGWE